MWSDSCVYKESDRMQVFTDVKMEISCRLRSISAPSSLPFVGAESILPPRGYTVLLLCAPSTTQASPFVCITLTPHLQSLAAWHSNMDEQSTRESSELNNQIFMRYHLERSLDWHAWQQTFGVPPTMPDDTLGTVYFDGVFNAEVGSHTHDLRYLSIIEHVTEYPGALQSAYPDMAWNDSHRSREPTAAVLLTPNHQYVASEGASEVPHPGASMPNSLQHPSVEATKTEFEHHNEPTPSDDGLVHQRQSPRFAGDEYTAKWIRGDRRERAGWCSRCNTW